MLADTDFYKKFQQKSFSFFVLLKRRQSEKVVAVFFAVLA